MSRQPGRLGSLAGPFVRKLLADLGPLLESYLIGLLSQALKQSSDTRQLDDATAGAAWGTGSPITEKEVHTLTRVLKQGSLSGFADHVSQSLNQQLRQHGASNVFEDSATGGKDRPDHLSA